MKSFFCFWLSLKLYWKILLASCLALYLLFVSGNWFVYIASAQQWTVLPFPDLAFPGKIGITETESSPPQFPSISKAPKGAPNVLLILLDDTGFGQSSTFGGPIDTPNFTRLANNGLRYTQFHTTAMCSPTRASLLTGRNHHAVGAGTITELAVGYPGYNSIMPKSAATIAEVLRQNGYNTAAFGKWHNTPDWETSPVGPFDRWPTLMGFGYWYGFHGGETNQWEPSLYEGISPVKKPEGTKDYHFTTDIADRTIRWIETQKSIAPDKPFFVYWAPGATHNPHHAPKEWIDKYQNKFDVGWDKIREETLERMKQQGIVPPNTRLTARSKGLPAWDSLSADQKKLFARMQEVFAGFLSHTDYEIGRILNTLEKIDELDNTLVMISIGDNGASAGGRQEGSINTNTIRNGVLETVENNMKYLDVLGSEFTYNHYPAAWAHAGNTPFKWVKTVASHFGGTRNPLIVSYPSRIKDKSSIRTQFTHIIDVVPTILELTGIPAPTEVNGVKQQPIHGTSFVYTFNNAKEPSRHTTQYFELFGNRGIYQNGWLASTKHSPMAWQKDKELHPFSEDVWELYNIEEDFSQANDLAKRNPKKLKELQDLFLREAQKYNVLPLIQGKEDFSGQPSVIGDRTIFIFYPGTVRIPEGSAPNIRNKSFRITADAIVPSTGAEGILVTQGGRFAGYSFLVKDNIPQFIFNFLNLERYTVTSSEPLPEGLSQLRFEMEYRGMYPGAGGIGRLFINDRQVGEASIKRTVPAGFTLNETFDVGEDTGTPVAETYQVPFKFTGDLLKITVQLGES